MEVTGPHVSPWLVSHGDGHRIPRAPRQSHLQFTSVLQASDSVAFAVVSLAEANGKAPLRVSVDGWGDRERIMTILQTIPLQSLRRLQGTEIQLSLALKRFVWFVRLKMPSLA